MTAKQDGLRTLRLLIVAAAVSGAAPLDAQQSGPIDPNWIYVTPLRWTHAPAGIPQRSAPAHVVVLYPEGEYVEVAATLIQQDKTKAVTFSAGDGTLIRSGTWSRTDDAVLRIHSRDVWKDNFELPQQICDTDHSHCRRVERPIPGPVSDRTCGFRGGSAARLAGSIRCADLELVPMTFAVDLAELERDARTAAAARIPKTFPAPHGSR